jgi:hypothetical protein
MRWALRLRVGAVAAVAIVGFGLSGAAAAGLVPLAPPQFLAPALVMLACAFGVAKIALAGGAALDLVLSKDSYI